MSIFSKYKDFKYLYPPRAETAMAAALLKDVDPGTGWIAQPKYNGSCAVLIINGRKDYKIFNRHAEELTLQKPLNYTALNDSDKYMVLCGEYLNKNKKGENGQPFNHKFVIWDILVYDGTYLLGYTVEQRLKLINTLFGTSRALVTNTGLQVFEHLIATNVDDIFVAPTYVNGFFGLYNDLIKTDLYEGIVLKQSAAKLEMGFSEKNNTRWQVKARKETKNYNF